VGEQFTRALNRAFTFPPCAFARQARTSPMRLAAATKCALLLCAMKICDD